MKYVKLISKDDKYYDAWTEVFNYEGSRFTLDAFYNSVKEDCFLCRGLVNGIEDGDRCSFDEFLFEIVEEDKKL